MQIVAMNHPARDPIGEIEWIAINGFDFVDFTLAPPAAAPDQLDTGAIRAALDEHGLGVVAHTAYFLPPTTTVGTNTWSNWGRNCFTFICLRMTAQQASA